MRWTQCAFSVFEIQSILVSDSDSSASPVKYRNWFFSAGKCSPISNGDLLKPNYRWQDTPHPIDTGEVNLFKKIIFHATFLVSIKRKSFLTFSAALGSRYKTIIPSWKFNLPTHGKTVENLLFCSPAFCLIKFCMAHFDFSPYSTAYWTTLDFNSSVIFISLQFLLRLSPHPTCWCMCFLYFIRLTLRVRSSSSDCKDFSPCFHLPLLWVSVAI